MNDLIKISPAKIGGKLTETVDARRLHAALGVETQFKDWIQRRIDGYGFVENQDFVLLLNSEQQKTSFFSRGGHNRKDYMISHHMAKELAMLENTPTGRKFRNYFIAREDEAIEKGRHLEAMASEVLQFRPLWSQIKRYLGLGLNQAEISKLCGVSKDHIRSNRRKMEACGLIEPPANLAKMQAAARFLPSVGGAK